MKKLISIILFSVSLYSYGQKSDDKLIEIVKLIPVEYFVELTESGRDSLLSNMSYTIPGGHEEETLEYLCEIHSDSCLSLIWQFTTGQRGFIRYEICLFQINNNTPLLLLCSYGGAFDISQRDLDFFQLHEGDLKHISNKFLPIALNPKEYMKVNTPDSIMNNLDEWVNKYYYVDTEEEAVIFTISSSMYDFEWIEYPNIKYTWDGKSFILDKDK